MSKKSLIDPRFFGVEVTSGDGRCHFLLFLGKEEKTLFALSAISRKRRKDRTALSAISRKREKEQFCTFCYFSEKEKKEDPAVLPGFFFKKKKEEEPAVLPGFL